MMIWKHFFCPIWSDKALIIKVAQESTPVIIEAIFEISETSLTKVEKIEIKPCQTFISYES